jgi:periodic tryptophan protein 1
MISSISWVPRGVAAKNPKKYEVSSTEQELISKIIEQQEVEGDDKNTNTDDIEDEKNDQSMMMLEKESNKDEKKKKNKTKTIVDTSHLPPELRMDEYSDDDDNSEGADNINDNNKIMAQMNLGRLLIGTDDNENDDADDNNNADGDVKDFEIDAAGDLNEEDEKDGDSRSYDTDDDLDDVPDTREYLPTNIDGLQAMNIGGGNANAYRRPKKQRDDDDGLEDDVMDEYNSNDDDADDDFDDDDDESFVEDTQINDTDAIILVAKTEEDFPSLEVHVYDTIDGNLYVHHDISLPAFPLCVEHINGCVPGGSNSNSTGNYCAIGTFQPGIEIWNLDVLNPLEPTCTLGGTTASTVTDELLQYQLLNQSKNTKNENSKNNSKQATRTQQTPTLRPGSHTDAVLSLSWNVNNVLASGSADSTVKIWDISSASGEPVVTYKHHTDKVQSVQFNPIDTTLVATGSYDRTVSLLDVRSPSSTSKNNSSNTKSIRITADCEGLVWDPYHNELLTVLADDGRISCWDVRQFTTKTPVWTFVPSSNKNGGISDIAYNPHVPGLLATCSTVSKTVSLWDTYSTTPSGQSTHQQTNNKIRYTPIIPQLITSKDMCGGKLYTVSFYPSLPWLLGTGGSGNLLSLWDLSSSDDSIESALVHRRFTPRMTNISSTSTASSTEPVPLEWPPTALAENGSTTTKQDDVVADEASKSKNKKNNKKKKSKKKVVHKSGL